MDLKTTYMGLSLRSPLVVSASPLSETMDNIQRMEEAGAAAVVMHSLFEEQLQVEGYALNHYQTHGVEQWPEARSRFPDLPNFRVGPESYLDHLHTAKTKVAIPIIASLNGSSLGGWTNYAKQIEQAGADALELNLYAVPTELKQPGVQIEQTYLQILHTVKKTVKIPVAVKLSPYFTNLANMAKQLDDAGADALVLFNRFYQPDINLDLLEVKPNLLLSTSQSMRLPLRWIAILYGQVRANLAASSGIHTGQDVLKMLMVGAEVTLLCSVLLKQGIQHIQTLELEMRRWMEEHEYHSVQQLRGSMSQQHCSNPSAFERAQYLRSLQTYKPEWATDYESSYYIG